MEQSTHDVHRASWLSIVNQRRKKLSDTSVKYELMIMKLKKILIITGFASFKEKPMIKCSYLRTLKHLK